LRLSLSIANELGSHVIPGQSIIIRQRPYHAPGDDHLLDIVVPVSGRLAPTDIRPEIRHTAIEADSFLALHHGTKTLADGQLVIGVDYLLLPDELPPIRIRADLSRPANLVFMSQIQKHFIGHHITFDLDPDNESDLFLADADTQGDIYLNPGDSTHELKRKVFQSLQLRLFQGEPHG